MAIPVHPTITGDVFLRNFDEGIMRLLGAMRGLENPSSGDTEFCYRKQVNFGTGIGTLNVPVYFSQPEPMLQSKKFPFITISRDDITLAMQRWMSVGQLEYRAGLGSLYAIPLTPESSVSGYLSRQSKPQAFPYDMTYTISVWDRYENRVQTLLQQVLKAVTPVGRVIVYDSLNLERSYEYYYEGSLVNLQEVLDADTRARGYALTIRVEGEIDQGDPGETSAVTGFDLYLDVLE